MKIIITESQWRLLNEIEEFINQDEVDRILDKMNKYGRDSLTDEELGVLGNPNEMDGMVKGYLEAALFTEQERMEEDVQDEYGDFDVSEYIEPISIDDFSKDSIKLAKMDCDKFLSKFSDDDLEEIFEYYDLFDLGNDFWFTRNGHGVGFWDRDLPENIKELLMDAVEGFKEVYLERGDNGELNFH